ncbi:hypothetical protein XFF6970_290049 [Xanthomonas citri pv. fuscans]|nr:hypothetical protein XFF6970_290049 [Xanthomonas citri pv. fuscans]
MRKFRRWIAASRKPKVAEMNFGTYWKEETLPGLFRHISKWQDFAIRADAGCLKPPKHMEEHGNYRSVNHQCDRAGHPPTHWGASPPLAPRCELSRSAATTA